jgi:hypothetical protein
MMLLDHRCKLVRLERLGLNLQQLHEAKAIDNNHDAKSDVPAPLTPLAIARTQPVMNAARDNQPAHPGAMRPPQYLEYPAMPPHQYLAMPPLQHPAMSPVQPTAMPPGGEPLNPPRILRCPPAMLGLSWSGKLSLQRRSSPPGALAAPGELEVCAVALNRVDVPIAVSRGDRLPRKPSGRLFDQWRCNGGGSVHGWV